MIKSLTKIVFILSLAFVTTPLMGNTTGAWGTIHTQSSATVQTMGSHWGYTSRQYGRMQTTTSTRVNSTPTRYAAPTVNVPLREYRVTLSACEISASNFATSSLTTSNHGRTAFRPSDNPIGEIDEESPIGEVLLPLLLCVLLYIVFKRRNINPQAK